MSRYSEISRRTFLNRYLLPTCFAALTPALSRAAPFPNSKGERPNVLLILADDQGWGDLPTNWSRTDIRMPVMDAVGRTGIRFTSFYVNPLCAPTRSSIMTGLYSMENGMWRGPSRQATSHYRGIRKDILTLPQRLQQAGYATGVFGKWHLGYDKGNLPNDRGFDEFYGFLGGAHTYELKCGDKEYRHNENQYCRDAHATDYITEKALDFMRHSVAQAAPFFCYVAYNAVHGPLWRQDHQKSSGKTQWLDRAEKRGIDLPRRDYAAVLEHMDHCAGRLLELLDSLGVEENTLVIYLSDNGAITMRNPTNVAYPGNNGPLRGGKGTVYEGGIRVPCVMRWKGRFPEGTVSSDTAIHADIFATCLDATGLTVPTENGASPVRGTSLIPHILSRCTSRLPDRTIFFELTGDVAIRRGRYKLVGKVESSRADWAQTASELRDTQLELYDIENDIAESRDLSSTMPDVYASLKKELIAYFETIARRPARQK